MGPQREVPGPKTGQPFCRNWQQPIGEVAIGLLQALARLRGERELMPKKKVIDVAADENTRRSNEVANPSGKNGFRLALC